VDFVLAVFRRLLEQLRQVARIHGKDEIECFEIGLTDLPCPLPGNIDAMLAGHRNRSAVRGVARVPATRSGGIDGELVCDTFQFGKMGKNAFGKG